MAHSVWRMAHMEDQGQTSLEMTVALILVVILLVASVKIFLWLNEGIVSQQVSYENTRLQAGRESVAFGSIDVNQPIRGVENAPDFEVLNIVR